MSNTETKSRSRLEKSPRTLSYTESKLLLEHLSRTDKFRSRAQRGIRDGTLALLMLDAGLRVNEVRNLLIMDLWFQNSPVATLTVRADIAKNHSAREVPLTERLMDMIKQMYKSWWRSPSTTQKVYAFYGYDSEKAMTSRQIENIIGKAGRMVLNKHVTPHMLRHTFATRLMRKTNARVVQKLLGHSTLSSTQVYLHPNADDLKSAIAGMENEIS